MMAHPKLRLGLLLKSPVVPAWFYRSIERTMDSGCAEFCLILLNENGCGGGVGESRGKHFVYEALNRVDEKIFTREPDAFKMMDLKTMLSGVPSISIRQADGANEGFTGALEFNLDILLTLGPDDCNGKVISAAKYGAWYCAPENRGGPPGFWETVESWPVTGSTLSMISEGHPNGRTLYRSQFLTYPFSPVRNRNILFWATSSFIPRQIELLYRLGEEKFLDETARFNREFDFCDRPRYGIPSNFEAVRMYTRMAARLFKETVDRIFSLDTWFLLFSLDEGKSLSFSDFKKMVPPKDRFWADPQIIQKDGRTYIFVEELFYKNGKGHISVIEMDAQGRYREPVPVLVEGHHLSYPFVFEHENQYYLVPESAENKSIDLYECVEFPTRWKLKMSLMKNVQAVDTTLFHYQGKWWLFSGIAENEGAFPEVELFLFYADDLLTTQWTPHPMNPIISDVTTARPAGRLFIKNGKIYRPSQDCSGIYGHGFNLNEVQLLTQTEYLEKKVVEVKPNWDRRLMGTHTYSRSGALTVIDVYTRRSKYR